MKKGLQIDFWQSFWFNLNSPLIWYHGGDGCCYGVGNNFCRDDSAGDAGCYKDDGKKNHDEGDCDGCGERGDCKSWRSISISDSNIDEFIIEMQDEM